MISLNTVAFDAVNEAGIRHVRIGVFVEEQGVDSAIDFDGLDANAIHVLVTSDNKPIATGRMLEDGHIGRIAVLKSFRGQGLGARVMLSLVEEAQNRGYKRVYLGAQKYAVGFYSGLGFVPYGEEYIEAGIVPISMQRMLN